MMSEAGMILPNNVNVRLFGCDALPERVGDVPIVWDPRILHLGCHTNRITSSPFVSEVWRDDGIHLPMPSTSGTDFQLDVHRLPNGMLAIHQRNHPKAPP